MAHEVSQEDYKQQVSSVWRVTIILSIITIVEVSVALYWYYNIGSTKPKMWLNLFLIVMSILKAYYIIAEFMHLKYETRALQLCVLLPLLLFVWGIIAFLLEGESIRHLRHLFSI